LNLDVFAKKETKARNENILETVIKGRTVWEE
jgi:hypothetical protein